MMKRKDTERDDTTVEVGSDNIFADLGFPDAEERLLKAKILVNILGIIEDRHLTQKKVAAMLSIDRSEVSKLKNCKISGFSVERLLRFWAALGQDISITSKPTDGLAPGKLSVMAL